MTDERFQFRLRAGEVVLVEDPDLPALGPIINPNFHSLGKKVIAEDPGIEAPGQRADLTQRSFPWQQVRDSTRPRAVGAHSDPHHAEFP